MASDINKKPNSEDQIWYIESEEANINLSGQFPIEDFGMGPIGSTFGDIVSNNMSHPITNWLHGNLENITFESMFWMNENEQEIESELIDPYTPEERFNTLKQLATRNSELNRPPICTFIYGRNIKFKCFIESISNIRLGYLQQNGKYRDIHFTLTLRKYVPSAQIPTDPSIPQSNTFYHKAKTYDTYESLAKQHYDQPLYGEIVRRFQGHKPDLSEGDLVILPKLEYVLKRRKIRPQSAMLGESDESENRIKEIFEERSTTLKVIGN